jgi:hypothetical protein
MKGDEVITLSKRTGTQEEFSSAKLESSMERAGAEGVVAREIAARLRPGNGETTKSFRSRVATELRNKRQASARIYEVSRRLEVLQSAEVEKEYAQFHPDTIRQFSLKANAKVTAQNNGKAEVLLVAASTQANQRQVRLNPVTVSELGATEGSRLAFKVW